MDKTHWSIDGLEVGLDTRIRVAALRYVDARDAAALLTGIPGGVLPQPRQVLYAAASGEITSAWRSPTETLILSAHAEPLERLAAGLEGAREASFVDQSGGIWAVRIQGSRGEDLLVRIGAAAAVPKPGEALIGRFAELTVLALCLRQSEFVLLVDRVYAEHLLGWISATIGDF